MLQENVLWKQIQFSSTTIRDVHTRLHLLNIHRHKRFLQPN